MKKIFIINSDSVSGSVTAEAQDLYTTIEIKIKVHCDVPSDCVIRAYFANSDLKAVYPIGIIDNFGNLSAKINSNYTTDTIIFAIKNTLTDSEREIGYAFFKEESPKTAEALPPSEFSPIENAKKLLQSIKTGNTAFDEVKNEIFTEIEENLKSFSNIEEKFEGFKLYKITDFKPMSSISAVKYTMFERDTAYSFDFFAHYLFGINQNKILIAFGSQNGQNPLCHLDDLSIVLHINQIEYHAVIIELADDGQYFIKN